MSEFEFMRDMPIGQYLPVDTPLKRLDPRTRILGATIFLAGITFLKSPLGLLIGLAASLPGRGWVVEGAGSFMRPEYTCGALRGCYGVAINSFR